MTKEKDIPQFNCDGCGLCCTVIGRSIKSAQEIQYHFKKQGVHYNPLIDEVASFPYGVTDKGACEKLGEDMRCTVYNERPEICNVGLTWSRFHSSKMTAEEYFKLTTDRCDILKGEASQNKEQENGSNSN